MAETVSVKIKINDLGSFKEVGIAANDLGTTTRTCHLASLRDGHPGQTQEATRTRPRTSHSDPPPGHPDGYFSKCW